MSQRVVAAIDSIALAHNFHFTKQLTANSAIWPMIKSNAYGHGLLRVAKHLSQSDALGVACIEEAIALRNAGVMTPLIVMSGFNSSEELQCFVHYQVGAVVHNAGQIDLLQCLSQPFALPSWLKIDTGMHRLGFLPNSAESMYIRLAGCIDNRFLGVMTHLANADGDSQYTHNQLQQFQDATRNIACPKSVVNSAGIFNHKEAHFDWVRPGIMLYGVSPFPNSCGLDIGLQPVMTLRAKLISLKSVKKGQLVGYGGAWRCLSDTVIGVVSIGYGDGYPRHARNGTPTIIHNKICPLVGRVSMDMIMVDLSNCPEARLGDSVTLWGKGLPVETIAKHAETLGYELLCGVTQRVKFYEMDKGLTKQVVAEHSDS